MENIEKESVKYVEDLYLELLKKYVKTKDPKQKLVIAKEIIEFKKSGLVNASFDKKDKKMTTEEYYRYKNGMNYKKVVTPIPDVELAKYDDEIANSEIDRVYGVRRRRYTKRILAGFAGVVLAAAIIGGVSSCSKKDKTKSSETTTTNGTSFEETSATTTNSTSSTFSSYDDKTAVPSMSNAMNGININEPTTATTVNNGSSNNGESSNKGGSSNGGSSNNGESSNKGGSSSPAVTEGTTVTQGTTAPTTESTTPTTERNPEVPGTTPVETQNTEPSNERNMRDVTVDVHDGKNPEYIEEDKNQTYPTYTTFETTAPTTAATTKPTTAATTKPTTKPTTGTVNGMPVEEDEDETYPTFFDAGEKNNSKAKTLSLRK